LLKNTRRKTIKLVDFGLARVVNENEQVREIMGTPEFVGKN
jgi:predicted acetyltransferase